MARGPRNVSVSFSARTLTHLGGVYLLHRFFTRLGLKKALTKAVHFPQRNARYSAGKSSRLWRRGEQTSSSWPG